MSKQKSHPWKKGASWHCAVCGQPIVNVPIEDADDKECPDCADGREHCEEWSNAIAAKNGK